MADSMTRNEPQSEKHLKNRKAEAFESSDADGQEIRDQVETEPNRSSDL